jgi:hypothetical protein
VTAIVFILSIVSLSWAVFNVAPVRQADKLRTCNQTRDGDADRPHDSGERAGKGGQGDQVKFSAADF